MVVCVFHPSKYIEEMLGAYRNKIHLISKEVFRHGYRFGCKVGAFYYDDIDLHQDMPELSNARNFFEIEEIAVTCDTPEIYKFLERPPYPRDLPRKINIGMTWWDLDLVGFSSSTAYLPSFKQEYSGIFVNEPLRNTYRERPPSF